MPSTRSVAERLAMGVIAGLVAFGLAYATRPSRSVPLPARLANVLETRTATFELHLGASQVTARSRDHTVSRDVDLVVVVDGVPGPLVFPREELRFAPDSVRIRVPLAIGDAVVDAEMELRADRATDTLRIALTPPPTFEDGLHDVALRAELSSEGQTVFVAGVGQIADRATVSGASLLLDSDPHPFGFASGAGPITVDAVADEVQLPVQPMRLSVTSPAATLEHPADLRIVVGESSRTVWRTFAEIAGVPTATVRGHVTGTTERSIVFGRDSLGSPQVRARANAGGDFALAVPLSVVQWYAAIDPGRASSLVSFLPSTSRELVLDMSPGGDLHVTMIDVDTHTPVTARLLVRGVNGTVDPSFGPDYRASGAGPIIDALRGDVKTPLPAGRYRVAATKGIEWSIDAKIVTIASGRVTDVELNPRHVVATPGVLGCDLHVHARPSFDTPVTPEDRVLSLVAAGVDFAVPTEHNLVGDYTSALETLDLARELLSVPGVEVTTYNRGFGHFGVFPFPTASPVPPFKHTTMAAIFRAVRAGDPNRYFQLNHPRLPKGIGYFNNIGFDPKAPRTSIHNRVDFDGIEVFNGYDNELPERVEQVLRDYWALLDFGWRYTATGSSDSHRIQFHWAGYPRTMVMVDKSATVETDGNYVDPLTVVANLKDGHAVVTSGPMIELELGGARPGDELQTSDDPIRGHLRIRAAPWIDVTHIDIVVGVVGGSPRMAEAFDVQSRPTQVGAEEGTLEEAQARTVRFDRDIAVAFGPENGWVQVLVRGSRRMDDVLPFMPVPPSGFTNPVYVVRRKVVPPPMPGVSPVKAP